MMNLDKVQSPQLKKNLEKSVAKNHLFSRKVWKRTKKQNFNSISRAKNCMESNLHLRLRAYKDRAKVAV
jgi:hypothetical protein